MQAIAPKMEKLKQHYPFGNKLFYKLISLYPELINSTNSNNNITGMKNNTQKNKNNKKNNNPTSNITHKK